MRSIDEKCSLSPPRKFEWVKKSRNFLQPLAYKKAQNGEDAMLAIQEVFSHGVLQQYQDVLEAGGQEKARVFSGAAHRTSRHLAALAGQLHGRGADGRTSGCVGGGLLPLALAARAVAALLALPHVGHVAACAIGDVRTPGQGGWQQRGRTPTRGTKQSSPSCAAPRWWMCAAARSPARRCRRLCSGPPANVEVNGGLQRVTLCGTLRFPRRHHAPARCALLRTPTPLS